jgi:hypothetical protein
MALETLEGIEHIGGFPIIRGKPAGMDWDEFDKLREEYPINITERMNTISFKIQNGPIKEVGINGCDISTIIDAVTLILLGLNRKFSCEENAKAINCLMRASQFLEERKANREKRGVEGLDKP